MIEFMPTVLALNLSLLSAPAYNPLSLVPFLKSIKRRDLFASSNLHSMTMVYTLFGITFVVGDRATPLLIGNLSTVVEAPSTLSVTNVFPVEVPGLIRSTNAPGDAVGVGLGVGVAVGVGVGVGVAVGVGVGVGVAMHLPALSAR